MDCYGSKSEASTPYSSGEPALKKITMNNQYHQFYRIVTIVLEKLDTLSLKSRLFLLFRKRQLARCLFAASCENAELLQRS